MKRTSNSRSSLFLIELIIAILFFSLQKPHYHRAES